MVNIKIVASKTELIPSYETEQSAGLDLKANISEPIELAPMERKLIPTGIKIQLPKGYEAQIRPRSGLAIKHGITVLNTPGTIDADYRGEVGVIIINLGYSSYKISPLDRIAQMVISKHETASFIVTSSLDTSVRGEGGFGHTGKN